MQHAASGVESSISGKRPWLDVDMMFMLMLMMMAAATEAGRSQERSRGVTSGACGGVGSGGKRVKAADKRDALLGKQYSGSKVEKKRKQSYEKQIGKFWIYY